MDKHIRRLDTDLARFEADLKEKQIESTDYDSTSSKGNKSKRFSYCVKLLPANWIANTQSDVYLIITTMLMIIMFMFKGDLRGPKEKKVSRTRSKVKNSDEDCSPKSSQKKVKLTQTWDDQPLFLPHSWTRERSLFTCHFCQIFISRRTEFSSPAVNFGNVHPSDVLDMPVDPNEPTYCLCHQVSYGEMIGCDNTDVSLNLKNHQKKREKERLLNPKFGILEVTVREVKMKRSNRGERFLYNKSEITLQNTMKLKIEFPI